MLSIKSPALWILGIRNLAFVQIYGMLSFTKKWTRFILQISLLTPVTSALSHTVQNASLNLMLQISFMIVKILIVLELFQWWTNVVSSLINRWMFCLLHFQLRDTHVGNLQTMTPGKHMIGNLDSYYMTWVFIRSPDFYSLWLFSWRYNTKFSIISPCLFIKISFIFISLMQTALPYFGGIYFCDSMAKHFMFFGIYFCELGRQQYICVTSFSDSDIEETFFLIVCFSKWEVFRRNFHQE